tara:strand:- start:4323 stop:5207 length:885 start_codon:yes stop_codon:yes gene_type:complete
MAFNRHGLGRHIPEGIKRTVRASCNFGCVICGSVPYDYDHLSEEFNAAEEHDPDDIVLLCDKHHRLKTAGILSVERILDAKKKRVSAASETRFKLELIRPDFETIWGSNVITAADNSILVDDEHVLTFRKSENDLEPLLLSGEFRDKTGNLLCAISDNEFVSRSDNVGDFTVIANRFTYKTPNGDIALAFLLNDARMHITSAFHVKRDAHVIVNGDMLRVGNVFSSMIFSKSAFRNVRTAISVGTGCDEFSYDRVDMGKIPTNSMSEVNMWDGHIGVRMDGRNRRRFTSNYDRF